MNKPLQAEANALLELFERSGGARYGFTLGSFETVLEQIACKYAPGGASQQKLKLWQELKVEELALARGCANGHEQAWEDFLTRFREKLYDIARGITKEDSQGRELADSIYADLYGMSERDGQRVSRLNLYMGRGSLEGWLRTVMVQEFVNRYRKQKRLVSLDEEGQSGVQFVAEHPFTASSLSDGRLGEATDDAVSGLPSDDRLILAAYYLDKRTLTEIGRLVGVHESTISRRLDKLLKTIRKQVITGLQARGMNRGQAEEAMEADVRFIGTDLRSRLQENRPATFQEDKGSN
ncbi:MAG TPA: sigma-70 family RNA polymerase sigma factor [Candidatus Saccharimonadales bacterium]|nr:sigma-70 family RNA polymerase sigma factor [Candidatus Saccharimonadales bacterium]